MWWKIKGKVLGKKTTTKKHNETPWMKLTEILVKHHQLLDDLGQVEKLEYGLNIRWHWTITVIFLWYDNDIAVT